MNPDNRLLRPEGYRKPGGREVAAGKSDDNRQNRRIAKTLAIISLLVFGYFYQAGGWNQNSRFDLVRALVEKKTAAIDAYHRNTGDKGCRKADGTRCKKANFAAGDHYYCDKAPGASLLAAVAYAPIYWFAGSEKPSPGYLAWSSHAATVFSVALPSAIAVAFLFLLLLHFGVSRAAALATTGAYAFGTLALPYSTLLYGHQLAGALMIIAFALIVWASDFEAKKIPGSWSRLASAGALLGFAVAVEYPAALAVVVISPWVLWRFRKSWPGIAMYAAGGLAGGMAMFLYHWIVFGGPLTLPYEFVLMPERHQGAFMGIGALEGDKLWKVTFSAYRGLFFSAPWLLLAFGGLGVWLYRGGRRVEMIIALIIFILFVWLNASVAGWHGGWTLGARYLIPALPFLALLAAGLLFRFGDAPLAKWAHRIVWVVFVALAVYSARNMVAATAVRPEVPQHVKKPFAQFVDKHFAKGNLAVNRQSINHKAAPRKADKQAFNLGMKIGLDGRASLLPLLFLVLAIIGVRHQALIREWYRLHRARGP